MAGLSLDLHIFKTYLGNVFNVFFVTHEFLGKIAFISYLILSDIISLTLVILLCSDTKKFRKFLLSFFIAGYIGLIFWYCIPATSPRGYIDVGVTHIDTSHLVQYKATPAPVATQYIDITDKIWIDPSGIETNVSTFPSMHATWAILVLCSLVSLIPLLSVVLIPWYIALCIGAIAIYQHFGVDMIAGAILGLIIFISVGKLLDFEDRYFEDRYSLLYIWNIFEEDTKKLFAMFKKLT